MFVDAHPPVPNSAVFDPATLMRNKQNGTAMPTVQQQQQARQRYWSGMNISRPSSIQDANGISKSGNNKSGPHQQWSVPAEKEIYTPFKSVSGRVTPLDDPYGPSARSVLNSSGNEYMPAPQDPRERPPSRANSMMANGIYGQRRMERKSEGSVVYQPLTPANHASAWSNSLMFNKPQGAFDGFDQHEMGLGSPVGVPPLPHIQTLPRQLPMARNSNATPPEEPTHHGRQQVPQSQPFVTMNGYVAPEPHHQMHRQISDSKGNANRVTVVPNGTVIPTQPSLSSTDNDDTHQNGMQQNVDGKMKKKTKRRLSRQRGKNEQAPKSVLSNLAIVEKVAILHILLGACLFALGIARLLLLSTWGLGIELVYGVYVVLMGILGVIGYRRRHYCSLAACFAMSALSSILAIPPFVTGLLVTIPDTFRTVDPKLFTSSHEPYGVDILLSVICLLELIVAIVMSGLACSIGGRMLNKFNQIEQIENGLTNFNAKLNTNQQPIFHTSVNIKHPSMIKQ